MYITGACTRAASGPPGQSMLCAPGICEADVTVDRSALDQPRETEGPDLSGPGPST